MNGKNEVSNYFGHAAILLAVSGSGAEQQLLLTRRAGHLNIHAGEVAFPGGKWEEGDTNLLTTALRESNEEVGLDSSDVEVVGQLETCCTRAGIPVTPYFARVPDNLSLRPNPEELDALFWVPVNFFVSDKRVRTDIFRCENREHWAPVYHYSEFEIWGFTARVIVDFVNKFCGADIERANAVQEVEFRRSR